MKITYQLAEQFVRSLSSLRKRYIPPEFCQIHRAKDKMLGLVGLLDDHIKLLKLDKTDVGPRPMSFDFFACPDCIEEILTDLESKNDQSS